MPIYCSKQGMIDRFGQNELVQLTDRGDQPLAVIDDVVLNQALDDADSVINGYLAGRYALPLPVVPTSLERIAATIARYFLYDDMVPERVEREYTHAVAFLRDVSKGAVSFGVDSSGQKPPSNDLVSMESGGRVFERNKFGGFI